MSRRRADGLALAFCLIFLVIGSLWISELGIQNDEALFAGGIYPPFGETPTWFGKPFPVMLMSYVGALKSYVWWPIFSMWSPSAASTRFPAVALGALTIWLFYILLRQTSDERTALVSTALLAFDTSYTLTVRWDWGPVVLQHLCLVVGMAAIVKFVRTGRFSILALAWVVFGLGTWDKAIFLWALIGLGAAALIVFPRRLIASLNARTAAVSFAGFLVGAAPLVYYNFQNDFLTFRQNTSWSWQENLSAKARVLAATFEGRAVIGSITRLPSETGVREPDDAFKATWIRATEWSGMRTSNLYIPLLLLGLALLPLAWRSPSRSTFLFSAVFCVVTWLQMAFLQNAGTGAHHAILLWPMPHMAIGALLVGGCNRLGRLGTPLLVGATSAACLSSLAVTGTNYAYMLQNGGSVAWSDAIYPAAGAIPEMKPSYVCFLDWGFFETIRLIHKGKLGPCNAVDPVVDPETAKRQLQDRETVYMAHTDGNNAVLGLDQRFVTFAESNGYRKAHQRTFYDSNGRPIIEVFKLFRP